MGVISAMIAPRDSKQQNPRIELAYEPSIIGIGSFPELRPISTR